MRSLSSKATRQPPPGGCWRAGVRGAIRGVQPWDLAPPRPGGPCTGIAAAPRRDATPTKLLLGFCLSFHLQPRHRASRPYTRTICLSRVFQKASSNNPLASVSFFRTSDSSPRQHLRVHRGISGYANLLRTCRCHPLHRTFEYCHPSCEDLDLSNSLKTSVCSSDSRRHLCVGRCPKSRV